VVSVGTGIFADSPSQPAGLDGANALFSGTSADNRPSNSNPTAKAASAAAKAATAKAIGWQQLVTQFIASTVTTEHVHDTLSDLLPQQTQYVRLNPFLYKFISIDETKPETLESLKDIGVKYVRSLFSNPAQKESWERLGAMLTQRPVQ
jgi:hypothetical protein